MEASLITLAGFERLIAELELLRAKREALVAAVKTGQEGAGIGRRSDEHFDASTGLAHHERQIVLLEDRLASATVVRPDPADGELGVGEGARVRDLDSGELAVYRVVGAGEAEPAAGSISYTSPVGSALLGKRVGDVVEVLIPRGLLRLQILDIEV